VKRINESHNAGSLVQSDISPFDIAAADGNTGQYISSKNNQP
jgi:hypothetical protein